MKIRNILISIALLASGTVNATTVFSPEVNTDGTLENVDLFTLFMPANFTLGLFDASDLTFTTPLMVSTGNAVSFIPNPPGAGPYTATNDQTSASISIPTTLGGNAAFILGLFDSNTASWLPDIGATDISGGAGNAYSVSFQSVPGQSVPGQVWGIDMSLAVPVPPAVWLFGSGLLGLVGIARRRKPNKSQ